MESISYKGHISFYEVRSARTEFGADLEIAVLVKLFTTPKDNSIKPTSPDIVAFDGNFSFDL